MFALAFPGHVIRHEQAGNPQSGQGHVDRPAVPAAGDVRRQRPSGLAAPIRSLGNGIQKMGGAMVQGLGWSDALLLGKHRRDQLTSLAAEAAVHFPATPQASGQQAGDRRNQGAGTEGVAQGEELGQRERIKANVGRPREQKAEAAGNHRPERPLAVKNGQARPPVVEYGHVPPAIHVDHDQEVSIAGVDEGSDQAVHVGSGLQGSSDFAQLGFHVPDREIVYRAFQQDMDSVPLPYLPRIRRMAGKRNGMAVVLPQPFRLQQRILPLLLHGGGPQGPALRRFKQCGMETWHGYSSGCREGRFGAQWPPRKAATRLSSIR